MELKPYLISILSALDKNYDVEGIDFVTSSEDKTNKVVITFEAEDTEKSAKVNTIGGQWMRKTTITVDMEETYWKPYAYDSNMTDICPCPNCVKGKDE